MNSISGLPAHPLLVHLPVVAIPLAALGVVTMLVKPDWWQRYRWATLGLAFLGIGLLIAFGGGVAIARRTRPSAPAAP